MREFLHVDDMASAYLHLLDHHDGPQQVNVGTGEDQTIREIAEMGDPTPSAYHWEAIRH